MFGSENSIEPVRAVAAVAITADGRTAVRAMVDRSSIREATPDDLASAARRALGKAPPEPTPVKAAAEAKGGLFRRRPTEPEKPDAVAQQLGLYTAEKRGTRHYFSDYQQKQEVMRADPKRISTKLDDKQTVSAMLDLAQSRGWDTVRLKGSKDFQREAWVQSQARGMVAEGYRPTATDQQEAARRIAAVAPIQAAPAQTASAKAGESTVPARAAAPRYVVKVTNSVTVAASAQKGEAVPIKTAAPAQAAPAKAASAAVQAPAAAPAPARAKSAKAAPAPVQAPTAAAAPAQAASAKAAPAAAQASTAATGDATAADKAKAVPVQRKSVWDAVEATGKQARAADAATAKVTAKAGERSTSASTA